MIEPPPLPKKRKRIHPLFFVVIGASVIILISFVVLGWSISTRLDRQSDELEPLVDQLRDEGYAMTTDELVASLPELAPEENSAFLYAEAFALLVEPGVTAYDDQLPIIGNGDTPEYGVPYPEETLERMRKHLKKNAAAIAKLHEAASLRRGRYPREDWADVEQPLWDFPHHHFNIEATALLCVDAEVAMQDGDTDRATQSIRAAFRVAQSLELEPSMAAQEYRARSNSIALWSLERILNRDALGRDQLVALSETLDARAAHDAFLSGFQGLYLYAQREFAELEVDAFGNPNPLLKLMTLPNRVALLQFLLDWSQPSTHVSRCQPNPFVNCITAWMICRSFSSPS